MARLVVVSRNAALPFALNSAGHEVVVLDDEADVRWSEYVGGTDVVLLDLGDAHACSLLIDSVARAATTPVRVLLLATAAPAWDELRDNPRAGTGVLPLPLSMPRLSEALKELLHGPPLAHLTTPEPPRVTPPEPEPVVVSVVEAAPAAEPAQVTQPTSTESWFHLKRTVDPTPRASWSPPPPAPEAAAPEPVVEPEPESEPVEPDPEPEPVAAEPEPEPEVAEAPVAGGVTAPERHLPPVPHVNSVVRSLTHSVEQLSTMADTAQVVAVEARVVVPADASAVLVRDGLVWRVAGGENLRPLEHRIQLPPEHWLVNEVSRTQHGVLLSGGEGQWAELYGAPLSARPYLLATPLPPVGAMLLLARDDEPFDEADLERLIPLTEEAGHLLSDASEVRRLARLLQPFCDLSD